MSSFEVGRYRFRWVSEEAGRLPRFLGPTLRGGLGHTLRRMVCVTRLPACEACLLRFRCAYPVLFQPFAPPTGSAGGRYNRMPVPFVLRVPFGRSWRPDRRPGDSVEFEMVLVGRANQDLPYYVLALADLGRVGLGPARHRLRLEEVAAWTPNGFVPVYRTDDATLRTDVPPVPLERLLAEAFLPDARQLTVRFAAPVRLDLRGDLVYPVAFHQLVRALDQRLRALAACYGGPQSEEADLGEAERVRAVRDRTRWVDLQRYSTRQRTTMRIGGVVGSVTYEGTDFTPFRRLLAFGEWLGVGKLTSMGLGRMEVVRP
ncbi:MAG: CRISPR system precrRNA processing endoribonuclease RAMP protein Cas6 [Armatimonadota bacterium]|nr:CRISPR system precrRNA processing endoribonuclease RAMP protein Cas6 [Armatimonadota bacterium]MDR7437063.1 CRISPR system precrRNA processing endoribonuclease RAMP protein Cas6 [Armatimonadota bacterium]MDR7472866.1 CRISPR system precrRNA processing endoribonuclease RAMP protein Cas6 [Armatimonadota bacterium]MDR7507244.1 CRISPR system precrRNA processing endoribonuclease RAMP protein Cas6 [Armatimonadota bacterium]MDR7508949.1 CRISPR system precrRNA processing endoribonuclease RAMP protein 